jgi:hypothetical protein
VICQPGGGFTAHDVYVKTNWTLKPPRKIDTDSLARYDEMTCRIAEAVLRN